MKPIIRAALTNPSPLKKLIKEGLGAVENSHKKYFDDDIRDLFSDSIDIDKAFLVGHESENRWDYLLGYTENSSIIGVEPHSAKTQEISTVCKKAESAKEQLRGHLKPGKHVKKWLWVASKKVEFLDMEKAMFSLANHGVYFCGCKVKRKDLI
jgi:hypothetical protein